MLRRTKNGRRRAKRAHVAVGVGTFNSLFLLGIIHSISMVQLQSQKKKDLICTQGAQADANGLGNKGISGPKGSGTLTHQLSSANSATGVFVDEFDPAVQTLNMAIIWFHLHEFTKELSLLEPLYHNIEPLEEVSSVHCSMEDRHSVSSPRRILSFSKRGKGTVYSLDPYDKHSGFGVSGDHGPKSSEVYGFVGSITTVVATVIFLVWAYVPETWLHSIGISYYPNRYWALAAPTYALVMIVLALGFYIGLNFISTPPPTALNSIYDEFSKDPSNLKSSEEGEEQPIESISDIGIDKINSLMFTDVK